MSDDELASFTHDLGRVVAYVAQLQELDVSHVAPLYHPHEDDAAWRPDVAEEGVGRRGLEDSPGYENGLIRVPKVVE